MEASLSTNVTTKEMASQDEFRPCENFDSQHPIQEYSSPNHPVLSLSESFQADYCVVQLKEKEPETFTMHPEIKDDYKSYHVRIKIADSAGKTHPDVQAKEKQLQKQRILNKMEEEEMQYQIKLSELKKQYDKRMAQLKAELKEV